VNDPILVTVRTDWGALQISDLEELLDPLPEKETKQRAYTGHLAGAQFNELVTCKQVALDNGLTFVRSDPDSEHFHYPEAENDVSLTVYAEDNHATCWSDTMHARYGIPLRRPMDAFGLWTWLRHGGDFSVARAFLIKHSIPDRDSTAGTSANGKQSPRQRLSLVTASSVPIDRPTWVWDHRIPVGGTTLMPGREGLGKTLLVCLLAAQLSKGTLAGAMEGQPFDVIYVGIEDDRSTVLVPRLTAAGADLDRVHFLDIPRGGSFSLNVDADQLTELALSVNAALVVVDPLDSHLGPIDSHKKAEVQAAVARLAEVAQDVRCGALGLAHFNKSAMKDVLQKVVGSVGFTTAVRSVLGVGENPEDLDERLCVLAKANSTDKKAVPAIRFKPEKVLLDHPDGGYIDTAKATVLGEVMGIDPNSILIDPEERSATAECKQWLEGYLSDGAKRKSDIEEDSIYTPKVLRNARLGLRLIVNRDDKAKGRPSTWRLPGHK
jgi:hypothetical protein